MSVRPFLVALTLALFVTCAASAQADPPADARAFVQRTNAEIGAALEGPASPARAARIAALVDSFIDFDEIARGALEGAGLNDAQRGEVRDLLRRWVGRRYVGKLVRAVDLVVTYADPVSVSPQAWRVRVELRSATHPREPTVQLDYVVRAALGAFKVTDILTEGASLTMSCHDAFARILATSTDGYATLLRALSAPPATAALL